MSEDNGTGTLNVAGNFYNTQVGLITETRHGKGEIVFNGTTHRLIHLEVL